MFGLGLLLLVAVGIVGLAFVTKLIPGRGRKAIFLLLVVGGLAFYPLGYRLSPSYARFLELCERTDQRYQVLRTKNVDYIFLDRDVGADCKAGPTVIGTLPYRGFDCIRPSTRTTTDTFRYTKKTDWSPGCGLECFEGTVIKAPDAKYKSGHRQGYVADSIVTVTYDNGRMAAEEPTSAKLRFRDRLLLDEGVEMAFTRTYIYYPYGSGWATILGGASGSAPSFNCKVPFQRWNVLDVYKPRTGK